MSSRVAPSLDIFVLFPLSSDEEMSNFPQFLHKLPDSFRFFDVLCV